MAKGKPTPDRSKIERERPLAYSRRQKGGSAGGDEDAPGAETSNTGGANTRDAARTDAARTDAARTDAARTDAATTDAANTDAARTDAATTDAANTEAEAAKTEGAKTGAPKPPAEAEGGEPPTIEPRPANGGPGPDATPQPMRPVDTARARSETVAMPAELVVGTPPAMPRDTLDSIEDPTFMPGPRDVPPGSPTDPASPPGLVPSGDSRSLRKDNEFALVYRVQTAVISRFGVVGTRGQWRVVDYPTSSSASNAYAKEVSRFVAEGFSDYRD